MSHTGTTELPVFTENNSPLNCLHGVASSTASAYIAIEWSKGHKLHQDIKTSQQIKWALYRSLIVLTWNFSKLKDSKCSSSFSTWYACNYDCNEHVILHELLYFQSKSHAVFLHIFASHTQYYCTAN